MSDDLKWCVTVVHLRLSKPVLALMVVKYDNPRHALETVQLIPSSFLPGATGDLTDDLIRMPNAWQSSVVVENE